MHVRIAHDSIPCVNQPTEQLPQEVDLSTATILLVDDNAQNLELMQAFLEELPCKIQTASDGVEAIEMVERRCPNLIILDVMMPRMSGFEVCQKVKSQPSTRDTVVIMVTALNEVSDYERAVECGTNDFITKPAIGALVKGQIGTRSVTTPVQSAWSFLAANDPRVHIGLGESQSLEHVQIRWVDGETTTHGTLSNGFHTVQRQK